MSRRMAHGVLVGTRRRQLCRRRTMGRHERGLVAELMPVCLPVSRLYGRLRMQAGASEASRVVCGSGVHVPDHYSPPSAVGNHGPMFSVKSVPRARPLVNELSRTRSDACATPGWRRFVQSNHAFPGIRLAYRAVPDQQSSRGGDPSPLWVPACAGTTFTSTELASA